MSYCWTPVRLWPTPHGDNMEIVIKMDKKTLKEIADAMNEKNTDNIDVVFVTEDEIDENWYIGERWDNSEFKVGS